MYTVYIFNFIKNVGNVYVIIMEKHCKVMDIHWSKADGL